MKKIGFIGLGHMGGPMAKNLVKKRFEVIGFDLVEANLVALEKEGGNRASSLETLAEAADAIVTMLPAGQHVQKVCDTLFQKARPGTLLIDSSSIDVKTSQALGKAAKEKGFFMVDAPVSGGMKGAEAGTLTFMVGGEDTAFEKAKSVLEAMGKNIFHTGISGTGQAAKICNNMILAISMIGTCEAFNLAKKLGLSPETFFKVASVSSGQSWSLSAYCPVPGPVPSSPANQDYAPGFAAAMMLKDLNLSQDAAKRADSYTPLGALATELYEKFNAEGFSQKDFSGIIEWLADQ